MIGATTTSITTPTGSQLRQYMQQRAARNVTIPRQLFTDPVLEPIDRNLWVVIKLYQEQHQKTPNYDDMMRGCGVGSKSTISRSLAILRTTRWLNVKDELGYLIYVLHDRPLSIAEATKTDPSYLDWLKDTAAGKNNPHPRVSSVAGIIWREAESYTRAWSELRTRYTNATTKKESDRTTVSPSNTGHLDESKPISVESAPIEYRNCTSTVSVPSSSKYLLNTTTKQVTKTVLEFPSDIVALAPEIQGVIRSALLATPEELHKLVINAFVAKLRQVAAGKSDFKFSIPAYIYRLCDLARKGELNPVSLDLFATVSPTASPQTTSDHSLAVPVNPSDELRRLEIQIAHVANEIKALKQLGIDSGLDKLMQEWKDLSLQYQELKFKQSQATEVVP